MGVFSYAPATFTDKDLPNQSGKVFIVTGATSGIGEILAGILYAKHGKVYVAARSTTKIEATIQKLKTDNPESHGQLVPLHLDLNDLSTIKASAQTFLSAESQLHVLFNNAGVMVPPSGSKTAQGYELQLGTNNLTPQLFTSLLTPALQATAQASPKGTVRVVWVASSAAARFAPKSGVEMDNLNYTRDQGAWHKYGVSKAGNIFQAAEYAARFGHVNDVTNGILSVSLDPGNLKTPLYANTPRWQRPIINLVLKDPIYGAYTELFAGFSPSVTMEDGGRFIEPFGKIGHTREDIEVSREPKSAGGNGLATAFYDWVEKEIAPYK